MLADDRRDNLIRFVREILENLSAYTQHSGLTPIDFRDLLSRGSVQGPNWIIENLLRMALELQTSAPARASVIWSNTQLQHPTHPKPASWLVRYPTRTGHAACVILDRQRIQNTAAPNVSRLINLLCLHETGHVFLHWNSFFNGSPAPMAPHATAAQEADAWCFGFSFVMLIAEQIAEDFKNAPDQARNNIDHVWEWIRDLRM